MRISYSAAGLLLVIFTAGCENSTSESPQLSGVREISSLETKACTFVGEVVAADDATAGDFERKATQQILERTQKIGANAFFLTAISVTDSPGAQKPRITVKGKAYRC